MSPLKALSEIQLTTYVLLLQNENITRNDGDDDEDLSDSDIDDNLVSNAVLYR